jgi:hypothetical protein
MGQHDSELDQLWKSASGCKNQCQWYQSRGADQKLRGRLCGKPDEPASADLATALGEVDDVLTAISAAVVTGIGQLTPAAISHQIAGDRWVVTTAVLHCIHQLTVRT